MAELLRYDTKSLDKWKQCECCGDYSLREHICDDCCDEIDQEIW
jgi:ribosomal protein L32